MEDSDDVFEIFSPEETQNLMVKHTFMKSYTNKSVDMENHLHFTIPYNDQIGTDLTNCFLEVELKVFKKDGKKLDDSDAKKIQPTCDFFDALFSKVQLYVNGTTIGDSAVFHPQTAFLQRLLNPENSESQVLFGVFEHV
jgi:hypothetical protein